MSNRIKIKIIFARIGLFATLTVMSWNGIADESLSELAARVVVAMRLSAGDDFALQYQAKEVVPKDRLAESLECIRQGVRTDLMPVYVNGLITAFTKEELIEALSFYDSAAWGKAWVAQEIYMMRALGMPIGSTSSVSSLSSEEEKEIKKFISSESGGKFFSYARLLSSNPERNLKMASLNKSCITSQISFHE